MLIGSVVDDEFGNDLEVPFMRFVQKFPELLYRAIAAVNTVVIDNIISIILQWRRIKVKHPDGRYT